MTRRLARILLLLCCCSFPAFQSWSKTNSNEKAGLILIKGAAGDEEFGKQFSDWAEHWEKAANDAKVSVIKIGFGETNSVSDKDQLVAALDKESKNGSAELWIILLGHGTFDGKEAKFNLRGPDFSSTELAEWLKPFTRPLAVIDTSSASGPFLNKLSAPGRVVITATRSGYEQNYARFGQYFSAA